jgi:Tfp pilus assembly protein PilF
MRCSATFLASLALCAVAGQATAEQKVALVIGNEAYTSQQQLDNPARDAQVVGEALQKLGFKLVGDHPLINLDKATTDRMVTEFGVKAQGADIALFYYSGHGMQLDGRNYLLPIDTSIPAGATSTVVGLRTLTADTVLNVMSESHARLKILLLDACRTPFVKGPSGGFGPMSAPIEDGLATGTVIGFATQPNTPAWTGQPNGTSPYAKALATFISVRGLELFSMFNEVGLRVMSETHNAQQPWINASPIKGRIYFNPADAMAATVPAAAPVVLRDTPEPPVARRDSPHTGKALEFIQRASIQLGHQDFGDARATLTEAIAVEPNSAAAFSYRGFAWYLEGLNKMQDPKAALSDYRRAFVDLDTAIQLEPSNASMRRHRGDAILATYQARKSLGLPTNDILDRAIDDLNYAVRLDPTSKSNAYSLGKAHLTKGSYRLAIEKFNNAIQIDPSYATPYAGLCAAYQLSGDVNSARKYAQLAANRDSDLSSKSCLNGSL